MLDYDIVAIAAELMLTPEDMKEIYELYFLDTQALLAKIGLALGSEDYITVRKAAHALKGASLNLRMAKTGALATQMEDQAQAEQGHQLAGLLTKLKQETEVVAGKIDAYYGK